MADNDPISIDILKRASRRSISLHITQEGLLEVRAPHLVPRYFINQFVASKRDWIIKTKLAMTKQKPTPKIRYHEGSVFRFAGIAFTLHITEGNTMVTLGSRLFFPKKFIPHAKSHMETWCRTFAKKHLTSRLDFYAHQMHASYKKITIRDTSSRWGSCSSTGTISFAYRLILADPSIIDYVVIHELAHTIHHNHGKSFWDLVGTYYPEYKKARAWLKESGSTLRL